ncbi:MAG: hypothetical protein ICV84_20495, partial [Flavisolibacter sp.]|nr:hypothetical protein [Flavisolibacter sp.]
MPGVVLRDWGDVGDVACVPGLLVSTVVLLGYVPVLVLILLVGVSITPLSAGMIVVSVRA